MKERRKRNQEVTNIVKEILDKEVGKMQERRKDENRIKGAKGAGGDCKQART